MKRVIASLANQHIKDLCRLRELRERALCSEFLVEGWHQLEEASKRLTIKEILTTEDYASQALSYNPPMLTLVPEQVLKKLGNAQSMPKVIGVCAINSQEIDWSGDCLLLDDIQDPGNLGTLIRSACAFGFRNVVASLSCVDFYNEKVVRSAQGYLFALNLVRANLSKTVETLIEKDFAVMTTNLSAQAKALDQIDFTSHKHHALVLGNEGHGVSSAISTAAGVDNIIIATSNQLESLNVAIAGSIIMQAIYHQKNN